MPPATVICTYRVKPEALDEFLDLLRRHRPALEQAGLVTDTPTQTYVGEDRQGPGPVVVDIFEWAEGGSSRAAHENPAVADVWGAMIPLCEERYGFPAMDFPHFEPLHL